MNDHPSDTTPENRRIRDILNGLNLLLRYGITPDRPDFWTDEDHPWTLEILHRLLGDLLDVTLTNNTGTPPHYLYESLGDMIGGIDPDDWDDYLSRTIGIL